MFYLETIGKTKNPDQELKTQFEGILQELKNSDDGVKKQVSAALQSMSGDAKNTLKNSYNFY